MIETTVSLADHEAHHWARHQEKANDIDEHVAYMMGSEDDWGNIRAVQHWNEVTDQILQSAVASTSDDSLHIAQDILETGLWNDRRIDVDIVHYKVGGWSDKWPNNGADLKNVREAYIRRLFYAHLALYSPDTFNSIQQHDIVGLHGTEAVVLPSILASKSLLSHAEQHKRGILTGSGEPYPARFRRDFISFGSIHSPTGFGYSEHNLRNWRIHSPKGPYEGYALRCDEIDTFNQQIERLIDEGGSFLQYANEHSFGVVFGLSRKALWSAGIDGSIGRSVQVDSDIDEIGFAQKVSLEYLPTLFVPEQHLSETASILPESIHPIASEAILRAQQSASYTFRVVSRP